MWNRISLKEWIENNPQIYFIWGKIDVHLDELETTIDTSEDQPHWLTLVVYLKGGLLSSDSGKLASWFGVQPLFFSAVPCSEEILADIVYSGGTSDTLFEFRTNQSTETL